MSNCPLCGISVLSFKLEEHVNACLDKSESCSPPIIIKERSTKTLHTFLSGKSLQNAPVSITSGKCSSLYETVKTPRGLPIPHVKTLFGTRYVVDAFKCGPLEACSGYFLSHFHSDHYEGLTSNWAATTPILCSLTTAKLVMLRLKVKAEYIRVLSMNEWIGLDETTRVLLIDANHCPGSAMFLFEVGDKLILHTGDCRAGPSLIGNLKQSIGERQLHAIYLDTTYCAPQHTFPCQTVTIKECADFVNTVVEDRTQVRFCPIKRLVLVGSYVIGKERIALAIATKLNSKIYAEPWKRTVLATFEWPELWNLLTDDPHEASVHIVSMAALTKDGMSEYLEPYYPKHATNILAIRPTGWTGLKTITHAHDYKGTDSNGKNRVRKQALTVHSVPYSEHSSFTELAELLAAFPAEFVIPTVGNDYRDLYIKPSGASPIDSLLYWHSILKS